MEVFCLSNGHGEDQVAVRVAKELKKLGAEAIALPMVGLGSAYRGADIDVLEAGVQSMPSGGFVRMESRQLWTDLKSGLLALTWKQIRLVWAWSRAGAKNQRLVLAVGDIVPLLLARLGGCDFAFIATAKSEYYWRDRQGRIPGVAQPWGGSVFFAWERFLMSSRRCRGVFVRDRLTAEWLDQKFKLKVQYLGNPMMDGLEPRGLDFGISSEDWVVSILPGSRAPEAYANWAILLHCAQILARNLPHRTHLLVAIASDLELEILVHTLTQLGWVAIAPNNFRLNDSRLHLVSQGFGDCLHLSHLGLAMAGTATEQLVGLGKPVIAIAGNGPQFTREFALDQCRLLGISVRLIEQPEQIALVIQNMLEDPDYFQIVVENGKERMGLPGASVAIAKHLNRS